MVLEDAFRYQLTTVARCTFSLVSLVLNRIVIAMLRVIRFHFRFNTRDDRPAGQNGERERAPKRAHLKTDKKKTKQTLEKNVLFVCNKQ